MDRIINDFTINIATANGTGSQSANLILLQSLDMGVPSAERTSFLPTLRYQRGTLCASPTETAGTRRPNPHPGPREPCIEATSTTLEPGSVVIWNSDTEETVDGGHLLPGADEFLAQDQSKIAKLVTNIIYVGVLAELLGTTRCPVRCRQAIQRQGHRSGTQHHRPRPGRLLQRAPDQGRHLRRGNMTLKSRSSSLKATKPLPSVHTTAASNCWRGTPSRPLLRWQRALSAHPG